MYKTTDWCDYDTYCKQINKKPYFIPLSQVVTAMLIKCTLCSNLLSFSPGVKDCLKCPRGFYCPEGTSDPVPCPPGSFNPLAGQEDLADCRECNAGKACTQVALRAPDVDCMQGWAICPRFTLYRHVEPAIYVILHFYSVPPFALILTGLCVLRVLLNLMPQPTLAHQGHWAIALTSLTAHSVSSAQHDMPVYEVLQPQLALPNTSYYRTWI